MKKLEKIFDNLMYPILAVLIIAQCVVGGNFLVGQCLFLVADVCLVIRDFVLDRPVSDKVKDFAFVGVTIGLILIKLI